MGRMGGGMSGEGSGAAATVSEGDCSSIADAFTGSAPAVGEAVLSATEKESSRPRARIALFARPRHLVFGVFKRGERGTEPAVARPAQIGPAALATAPEKSIAVLPFENLSEEKQNAYFADGVQDEILTDLAKIADLKVISR